MVGTDWIATFLQIFEESQHGVLEQVERAGFERGIQRAAQPRHLMPWKAQMRILFVGILRDISKEGANWRL